LIVASVVLILIIVVEVVVEEVVIVVVVVIIAVVVKQRLLLRRRLLLLLVLLHATFKNTHREKHLTQDSNMPTFLSLGQTAKRQKPKQEIKARNQGNTGLTTLVWGSNPAGAALENLRGVDYY